MSAPRDSDGPSERRSGLAARLAGDLEPDVLKVSAVVIVGALMSILDTTIVNIALRDISAELHASLDTIQWTVTAYLLALATVIPLSGWISERFDAKKVWATSIVLFTAGSALCGLASSPGELIFFRVLQGLGGGLILPVGMTLLAQAAGQKRVGRVMSIVGVPMLLGPVLGPVIGGLIVDNVSWRWIFYVNVPIGVIALALAAKVLKPGTTGEAGKLDWLGFLLASPGVALVVFGLSESASDGGFGATLSWAPIVAGLAVLALFVAHSLRSENPIIELRLFRGAGFSAAMTTVFFVGAALFGGLLVLPLYFQIARGQSPLDAGLLLAAQGVAAAVMMPLSGKLTDTLGGGRVAIVGLLLLAAGTVPFGLAKAGTSLWLLEGSLVVRGFGLAGTMMPSMAATLAELEGPDVPRATSALNTIQRVGGSLGTAILAIVLYNQLSSLGPGGAGAGAAAEIPPRLQAKLAEPIAAGFGHAFWWAFGLSLVALAPAAVLAAKGVRPGAEEEGEKAREGEEAGPAERLGPSGSEA